MSERTGATAQSGRVRGASRRRRGGSVSGGQRRSGWRGGWRAVLLACGAVTVAGCASRSGAQLLVLRGAHVFDSELGEMLERTVLIRDGVIERVAPPDADVEPVGADVRTLPGKWILPGFVDTHAHVALGPVGLRAEGESVVPYVDLDAQPEVTRRSLLTLLAFGVTTARDPGGPTELTVATRSAVARGELIGPRLRVAGAIIDTTRFDGLAVQVSTADEVRTEVRRQAAAGVDMIKLYAGLDPELLASGIDEARAQGLPAVGHLMTSTWTEGARLGLHSVLHIVPGSPALLPDTERAAYEDERVGTISLATWFERADLDGPEMRAAIEALARHETWVDPTLAVFEATFFGDDPARATRADGLDLATPALIDNWRSGFRFDVGWGPDAYERAHAAWPKVLELSRRLYESGVRLTAGTDANNPWVTPGPSFHRELELLVSAGIPARSVLQIATRNGAEALGLRGEIGNVAVGQRADLVVLSENPLADITATRSIEWVIQGGVIWTPGELLRQLDAGPARAR